MSKEELLDFCKRYNKIGCKFDKKHDELLEVFVQFDEGQTNDSLENQIDYLKKIFCVSKDKIKIQKSNNRIRIKTALPQRYVFLEIRPYYAYPDHAWKYLPPENISYTWIHLVEDYEERINSFQK